MSYTVNHYADGVPRSRKVGQVVGIHLKNHGKTQTKTDELGNSSREHWNDRLDVTVRPNSVQLLTTVKEN